MPVHSDSGTRSRSRSQPKADDQDWDTQGTDIGNAYVNVHEDDRKEGKEDANMLLHWTLLRCGQ